MDSDTKRRYNSDIAVLFKEAENSSSLSVAVSRKHISRTHILHNTQPPASSTSSLRQIK